jgi:hypothetical protein
MIGHGWGVILLVNTLSNGMHFVVVRGICPAANVPGGRNSRSISLFSLHLRAAAQLLRPMKQLGFLLLLLLAFGCEDDDDPRVAPRMVDMDLAFMAEYDDRPLAIQSESYAYPTGPELKVLLFQYYVSDLELLPADGGDPVLLSEIELIKWDRAPIANGAGAVQSRNFEVPEGNYRGIRFGLGVKPSLNAIDPNNFAADYVLN